MPARLTTILLNHRYAILVATLIILRLLLVLIFIIEEMNFIHPDTAIYLELASEMLANGIFQLPIVPPEVIEPFGVPSALSGRVLHSLVPYGPEIFRTPGYPIFLTVLSWLGLSNPYSIVFVQELVYGSAIFLFYYYGAPLFSKNIHRAGVIFMLLDPGGFAFPKLLLSETLFLPFLLASLLALGHYLRQPKLSTIIITGIIMGLGAWVRPAITYFPLIAAITLIGFDFLNRHRWLHAGVLLLTFFVVISPWIWRNYALFDKVFISGQTSNMIANYHVPMVWDWEGVIPYYEGQDQVQVEMLKMRRQWKKTHGAEMDGVTYFRLQQSWALKELSNYPLTYFKTWIDGSLKTMYEPFAFELYDVMNISDSRIHFTEIMSKDMLIPAIDLAENPRLQQLVRIGYYLLHQDKIYLLNLLLTLSVFIFALPGSFVQLAKRDCFWWLLLLANFYFICAPGPMGYARFRFPVNVFWFIQAYLGFVWLLQTAQHLLHYTGLAKKPAV